MSSIGSKEVKANQILDRVEKMLLGNKNKQQALQIVPKCYFLHWFRLNKFAYWIYKNDGNLAKNGFEVLKKFDSNGEEAINKLRPKRLWKFRQDTNQNAKLDKYKIIKFEKNKFTCCVKALFFHLAFLWWN